MSNIWHDMPYSRLEPGLCNRLISAIVRPGLCLLRGGRG